MALQLHSTTARALVTAGLFFGVAAAQAAAGVSIDPSQEAQVAPGMSAAQVRSALGRPAQDVRYAAERGHTFSYHVIGNSDVDFDIDFGRDGKVATAGEREIERD